MVLILSKHINFIISNNISVNICDIEGVMWANTFLYTFLIPVFLVYLRYDELQDGDEQNCLQVTFLVSFLIRMKNNDFNMSLSILKS